MERTGTPATRRLGRTIDDRCDQLDGANNRCTLDLFHDSACVFPDEVIGATRAALPPQERASIAADEAMIERVATAPVATSATTERAKKPRAPRKPRATAAPAHDEHAEHLGADASTTPPAREPDAVTPPNTQMASRALTTHSVPTTGAMTIALLGVPRPTASLRRLGALLADIDADAPRPTRDTVLDELRGQDPAQVAEACLVMQRALTAHGKLLAAQVAACNDIAAVLGASAHHALATAGLWTLDRPLASASRIENPGAVSIDAERVTPAVLRAWLADPALADIVRHEPEHVVTTTVPERLEVDKKAVLARHRAGTPLPAGLSVTRSERLAVK